jgi:hypothetical protein
MWKQISNVVVLLSGFLAEVKKALTPKPSLGIIPCP